MSPSTIDLVLTNYKVNLANITADHIPVLCKADMSVDYIRVLRYNYRFADWNKFRNIINSELGSIMLSPLHNPVDIKYNTSEKVCGTVSVTWNAPFVVVPPVTRPPSSEISSLACFCRAGAVHAFPYFIDSRIFHLSGSPKRVYWPPIFDSGACPFVEVSESDPPSDWHCLSCPWARGIMAVCGFLQPSPSVEGALLPGGGISFIDGNERINNPVDIDNILNRFQEVVLKAQTESIPKGHNGADGIFLDPPTKFLIRLRNQFRRRYLRYHDICVNVKKTNKY